ncbi:antibiotic biosynthesis monooxygenase [Paenibacillus sp. FSL R7-0333]|uniref:antibiotic biosynthesis monooxygenase n=1 Tax=Paenibacillus sp. FSL R7-0333 TaxID=1926587 RepID=UPI00096E8909|nr:antibiotic biosynthesis monooxygenase [Paenibacillus sp. FSL R7-0333]
MLVVTNTIKIKEGHGEALASRFSADNGVQSIPGFIRMEVWRGAPKEGVEELKISTVWENEEALNGWTSSPAFRDSHRGAGRNEAIVSSSLDKYELVHSRTPNVQAE